MMRIAIAGGGGFAYLLAFQLCQSANAVIVLSRNPHPEFEENLECQVTEVDFDQPSSLRYALQGVDLLISTFTGQEQINLIHAAKRARVRLFVPSEFEGALAHRPTNNDPLDRGSAEALELLRQCANSRSHPMQYTVFSCGILYERFAPGGLANYGMGHGSGVANQGDFLIDVGNATADIVETNSRGQPVQVCMTSVADVARFIAAAVEMGPGTWPREFKMRGDRLNVRDILGICSTVRGVPFRLQNRRYSHLRDDLDSYAQEEDWGQWHYVQQLLATADGRYDFRQANLNEAVNRAEGVEVEPVGFRAWLETQWGTGRVL